ncbi:MAG: signal peptidase I [Chloroflexota bacterium]
MLEDPMRPSGESTPPQDPLEGQEGVRLETTLSEAGERSTGQSRSSFKPVVVEILQTILLTLLIFVAVRSVVQNFKVDGASMEPTLHTGQYLLIVKAAYLKLDGLPLQVAEGLRLGDGEGEGFFPFGGPQRGDIVVFRYPGRPDRDFIKRIIALPGDTVQIERGRVSVNGETLQEDYIRALPTYSLPPQRVPEGNYFVLGDNRPNSSDSHIWGYVPEANLIGKAWLSYWPPNEWGVVANRGLAGS